MNICISSSTRGKAPEPEYRSFDDAIFMAEQAGIYELDYMFSVKRMTLEGAEETFHRNVQAARDRGFRFPVCHLPFDYPAKGDEEGWKRFFEVSTRCIDLAVSEDITVAAIHPGTMVTTESDPEREYRYAHDLLEPYAEYADKRHFTLGLENMRTHGIFAPKNEYRFGCDVDEVIRLADDLKLKITWDTGHANISGQDQYSSLMKVGSRLVNVHVNDNMASEDIHVLPFLGTVDWEGFTRALRDLHYQGSLNIEVGSRALPRDMAKEYFKLLKKAGDRLAAMIEKEA